MSVGTRSLLYGAHCFFIHPLFVFVGWWKLYGFPLDLRLWVAFVVHDWGYWGKPNMDGVEGETHPILGAKIMGKLFGSDWYDFCLLHSRFYAKQLGRNPSRLCAADKLAVSLEPWWFYLPRVLVTGEIHEYMKDMREGKYTKDADAMGERVWNKGYRAWFQSATQRMRKWALDHAYDLEDKDTYQKG